MRTSDLTAKINSLRARAARLSQLPGREEELAAVQAELAELRLIAAVEKSGPDLTDAGRMAVVAALSASAKRVADREKAGVA